MSNCEPSIPPPLSAAAAAIADATIGVIASNGFDAVSIRSVAKAAEVAPGTVQHHFRSRDDLLVGALTRMVRRQVERLTPSSPDAHPSERLRSGLLELLPIDTLRREEGVVWVAFSAAASTRPSLQRSHAEVVWLTRDLIRGVLEDASAANQLRSDISVDIGSVLLSAVIDGLIVDGINATESDVSMLIASLEQAIALLIPPLA